MDEPANGDAHRPPGRVRSQAGRLARRAESLREQAHAFAASAASDEALHPARARALRALAEELHATADEVARLARDLEEH
ncbi:hypothetical protein [Salinarimonas sp.]|uniref:hypothetical protein n=1 Tax=Salinarimonas sp. TaxID=2766526 RepID=UPI0032D8BA0C